MKTSFFALMVLFLLPFEAFAAKGELAPRTGLGPLDKAKVHEVQAQKWSRMGTLTGDTDSDTETQYTTSSQSASGIGGRSRNCVTSVGNVATQKGVSSGRYGPQNKNNNIVVVKGDVINVCK